jgi:hypothetical protein
LMGPKSEVTKPPKGLEIKAPEGSGQSMTVPTAVDPRKMVGIPERYASAESSGLTFTVAAGEQTHNINLTP